MLRTGIYCFPWNCYCQQGHHPWMNYQEKGSHRRKSNMLLHACNSFWHQQELCARSDGPKNHNSIRVTLWDEHDTLCGWFTQSETTTPGQGSFPTGFNRNSTWHLFLVCLPTMVCSLGKQFKSWALRTDAPVKKIKIQCFVYNLCIIIMCTEMRVGMFKFC